jgi:molybdenum cofactor biosynthesis enzyme MoaA
MKLEDIGFYTLSDERAANTSNSSPLQRGEIIITDKCNFKCPYCRGVKENLKGEMTYYEVVEIIGRWADDGLENIRFSGGEPTLHPYLDNFISYANQKNINRVAISTNGSAELDYYKLLLNLGLNDISISLDACCSSFGEKMNGGIKGIWDKTINNIRELSKLTYVTVGMVFNKNNVEQAIDSIMFADSLGVSDIRVISSAQYNKAMSFLKDLPKEIKDKYPILKYRINRAVDNKNVRGLSKTDCNKCFLVLDDVANIQGYNYPCIIYLREGGKAINYGNDRLRESRLNWFKKHDSFKNEICRNNCLDVCIEYNNKCQGLTPSP